MLSKTHIMYNIYENCGECFDKTYIGGSRYSAEFSIALPVVVHS